MKEDNMLVLTVSTLNFCKHFRRDVGLQNVPLLGLGTFYHKALINCVQWSKFTVDRSSGKNNKNVIVSFTSSKALSAWYLFWTWRNNKGYILILMRSYIYSYSCIMEREKTVLPSSRDGLCLERVALLLVRNQDTFHYPLPSTVRFMFSSWWKGYSTKSKKPLHSIEKP